jgi:serine/threonine protein kinase
MAAVFTSLATGRVPRTKALLDRLQKEHSQLESLLGEGAMGEVYLARHPMIGKEVAVKILRPELSDDDEVVGRFFQEAKAVNEINHPNIVDIICPTRPRPKVGSRG